MALEGLGEEAFYGYQLHELRPALEVAQERFAVPPECVLAELRG